MSSKSDPLPPDLRAEIAREAADMHHLYCNMNRAAGVNGCICGVIAYGERIARLTWEARGRAEDWQSIESAPKDEPVLLYCPERGPTNEARIEVREYANTRGGYKHAWATHWMPLPPAPTSDEPAQEPEA